MNRPVQEALDLAKPPLVVVIGGPNGAGKTTTAPYLLQGPLRVTEFVNADPIAQGLSFLQPQSMAVAAGRVMLQRLNTLAEAREDFAFETTLSARSFAPWLRRLRASGYRAHLAFLSLPNPEIAIARVAQRVEQGGHGVPEAVIRRRFVSGLRNFFEIYRSVVDTWQLFDNAGSQPRLVASQDSAGTERIVDKPAWIQLLERTNA